MKVVGNGLKSKVGEKSKRLAAFGCSHPIQPHFDKNQSWRQRNPVRASPLISMLFVIYDTYFTQKIITTSRQGRVKALRYR